MPTQWDSLISDVDNPTPNALMAQYYVYKASGGYFARESQSGNIRFSNSISVDPVLNSAINAMTSGLAQDPIYQYWSGSRGGTIVMGPGMFNVKSAIILKSFVTIQGAGVESTIFQWASGLVLNNPNQIVFKSSTWETLNAAASGGPAGGNAIANPTLYGGDDNVSLRDFSIDGNRVTTSGQMGTGLVTVTFSGNVYGAGISGTYGHGIAYYGMNLRTWNLRIHHCPGAGLINQWYATDTALASNVSKTIGNIDDQLPDGRLFNLRVHDNGLEGIVLRAPTFLRGVQSYLNGECGIDQQNSQAMGSTLELQDFDTFLNGVNYSGSFYTPRSRELQLRGMSYVWNGIVEGSTAGDNIWIGGPAAAVGGPGTSGYILSQTATCYMWNVQLDAIKGAGYLIHSSNNTLKGVVVLGSQNITANSGAVGFKVLGNNNDIDGSVQLMGTAANSGCIAIQFGQDSNDPYQYGGTSGSVVRPTFCNLRFQLRTNAAQLQWVSGAASNVFQAQVISQSGQQTVISGGITIDRTKNDIYIQGGSGLGVALSQPLYGVNLQSASGYGLNFTTYVPGTSGVSIVAGNSGAFAPANWVFVQLSGGAVFKIPAFNS